MLEFGSEGEGVSQAGKERQDTPCMCRSTGVQEHGVDGDRSSG